MGTLLNRRRYMGGGSSLPYDAEVEYLQSDGTAHIDTGITPTLSYSVEMEFKWVSPFSSRDASATLFGCINGWDKNGYAIVYTYQLNKKSFFNCWGNNFKSSDNYDLSYLLDSWHTLNFSNKKAMVDGNQIGQTSTGTGNPIGSVYLFCAKNWANGNLYGIGTTKQIRSFKMYDASSNLVMDLIPVRKGTVGYMYDKVSGKLFGNNGTGEFTLGNDIIDIEYLEKPSNSNARIDLGTNADAVFEIKAQATTTLTVSMILIGRNTSGGGGTWFGVPPNVNGCWGLTSNSGGYSNVSSLNKTDITVDFTTNPIVGTIGGNTFTRAKGSGNSNWFLFSASNNGYPFIGRVYALKAYIGGKLALDLIPCRIGTTGYLRDRISGTFFGNAGTNAFVLGSDKT